MRFAAFIVCVALVSAVGACFLPWWVVALVAFGISFIIKMRPGTSFLAGFIGVSLFWLAAALLCDIPNNHILSTRVANIFHLSDYRLLITIISIFGGLIGGLSAWAATFFFMPRTSKNTVH